MSGKKKISEIHGKDFNKVTTATVATILLQPEEQTAAIEASAVAEINVSQEDLENFTKGYFAGATRMLGLILKGKIDVTLIKREQPNELD
jgi:hypothetical protein